MQNVQSTGATKVIDLKMRMRPREKPKTLPRKKFILYIYGKLKKKLIWGKFLI
jgi:hypothetical protein